MDVPGRLLMHALTGFTTDDGGMEVGTPTDSDRERYFVRQRSPATFVLDSDVDRYNTNMEGKIACFRAPREATIGQRFRTAIDNSGPDAFGTLTRLLPADADDVRRTKPTTIADLRYGDKPVVVGLGHDTNSAIAFDVAEFEGVHPTPSEFKIREYVAEEMEHEMAPEYEYAVVVAPEQSAAEADANAVASDQGAGPAVDLDHEETSIVTLVAVGAVLGAAAVYGSGRMDVGHHDLDDTTVDPSASVDDLVAAHEELVT